MPPLSPDQQAARDAALEAEADALLAAQPRDPGCRILSARQLRRRRQRELEVLDKVEPVLPAPGDGPEASFDQWACIELRIRSAHLTREERAILILKAVYGLTDGEMARVFGLHRETVIGRRKAAQAKLERVAARTAGALSFGDR